jgi:hypothetical protein
MSQVSALGELDTGISIPHTAQTLTICQVFS